MSWIVRIEGENEKKERLRIEFEPLSNSITIYGEYKNSKNKWIVFAYEIHNMVISLDELKDTMLKVIKKLRKRMIEYENLNSTFKVLEWIAVEENEESKE